MTFSEFVHAIYNCAGAYKNMGLFLIDLITQSGGTHFEKSDTKSDPKTDPLLNADLSIARKLLQKNNPRPFDDPFNEGDFSFQKSCAFLLSVLDVDKAPKLASELGIDEEKPDFGIVAKATAAYLGKFFQYGESKMPASITPNSLYFDAIRNPSAFCGDPATPEEIQLIIEAHNKCPLCKGKKESLYYYLSGRPVSNYEVVDIFDSPSADDDPRIGVYSAGDWKPKLGTDENRIILCPTHANLYKATKDPGMCQEMYAAKRQFHIEKVKTESSERHELGEKIQEILDMLLKSKRNAKENLFTGTLTIDEKMAGCDNFLIEDVTSKVTRYFNDIQDYLGDWEKKGDLDSSILAQDIKSLSKEMCIRGLSKEDIIRGITDAIDERTGHKCISACYVITCFFVQHCEVLSE